MKPELVHQMLECQAQKNPEAELVIDGHMKMTYADVDHRASCLAQLLVDQGVARGDRVGLIASNSAEYIYAYYAILKAGGIVVSLNAADEGRVCRELLRLCEARGLICGRRIGNRAVGVETLDTMTFVIGWSREWSGRGLEQHGCRFVDIDLQGESEPLSRDVRVSLRDRAAIVYTSGSTGKPKGVVLRHSNIMANTASIVEYLDLTSRDRVMVVLPFHYVYGKSLLNTHVAVGGSVVIENRFMFPQQALDTLEQSQATGFSGVPSTFAILMNRSNFATREFPHLRYITQAGGAMAPELQRRLLEVLPGKQIFIMYGATEASARLSYLDPVDLPRKIGSIGKAIPGVELRVLREDNTEAAVDEVGELVAQGENIMEGYWNDPEETAAVLDSHGYHTGDLARRDEEGFLYIVGRSREMIKSGAHRISPKEIEETLQEHAAVHEVAVVGIPDEILGESIVAFISAQSPEGISEKKLIDWCRQRLPAHKVPNLVRFVQDFPRNASGKIDKLGLANNLAPGE